MCATAYRNDAKTKGVIMWLLGLIVLFVVACVVIPCLVDDSVTDEHTNTYDLL